MIIRRAEEKDMDGLNRLLYQVAMVHHNGRPDLFKAGEKKYKDEELKGIIADDETPIFVAEKEDGDVALTDFIKLLLGKFHQSSGICIALF